jgi:hypothetical protein
VGSDINPSPLKELTKGDLAVLLYTDWHSLAELVTNVAIIGISVHDDCASIPTSPYHEQSLLIVSDFSSV